MRRPSAWKKRQLDLYDRVVGAGGDAERLGRAEPSGGRASPFPQGGLPNPTLTTLAVTYRAADALIERYFERPGLVG